jgi:hypothetical protein
MDARVVVSPKPTAIGMVQGMKKLLFPYTIYLVITCRLYPHQSSFPQAYFETPSGDEPLALDMGSMGKGQIWINGHSIGRYWTAYATGDCKECSYAGSYRAPKCQSGCGQPTQRW